MNKDIKVSVLLPTYNKITLPLSANLDIKVSVLLPTYNRADFLQQTLQHLTQQTYQNLEIIISDNCSTDNTAAVIQEFMKKDSRIKYFKNSKHCDAAQNFENALQYADGDFALFATDDDFIIDYDYIKEAVDIICENDNIGFVYAGFKVKDHIQNTLVRNVVLNKPTSFEGVEFWKELDLQNTIETVFIFDYKQYLHYVQGRNFRDYNLMEIFTKIALKSNVGYIQKEVIEYNQHPSQRTKMLEENIVNYSRVLRKEVDFVYRVFLFAKDNVNENDANLWLEQRIKKSISNAYNSFIIGKDEDLIHLIYQQAQRYTNCTLALYGYGVFGQMIAAYFDTKDLKIDFIIDDCAKVDKKNTITLEEFKRTNTQDTFFIIGTKKYKEIQKILIELGAAHLIDNEQNKYISILSFQDKTI